MSKEEEDSAYVKGAMAGLVKGIPPGVIAKLRSQAGTIASRMGLKYKEAFQYALEEYKENLANKITRRMPEYTATTGNLDDDIAALAEQGLTELPKTYSRYMG